MLLTDQEKAHIRAALVDAENNANLGPYFKNESFDALSGEEVESLCQRLNGKVFIYEEDGPEDNAIRAAAKERYFQEGIIEIDPDAPVSHGEDESGAYVQGWLWVDDVYFENPTNAIRSDRAETIIETYIPLHKVPSPESPITGLLADIQHYCIRHQVDFDMQLGFAKEHFQAETEEEG